MTKGMANNYFLSLNFYIEILLGRSHSQRNILPKSEIGKNRGIKRSNKAFIIF